MRNLGIIIMILIFKLCPAIGQSLSIGFGPTYIADRERVSIHPKAKGKVAGGNDDWVWQVKYEHHIQKNWMLYASYSQYPISTWFNFYKENEGGSFGWNGTNVKRIDFGIVYKIFPNSKFVLNPNIGLARQKSIPDGDGCICNDISEGIKPDDFELLRDIEADASANTQIVPVIGLKFGYAFWRRLELTMDVQQVFGFKTIQELRMAYTYKGVVQPEAISYSDGTGRFWVLSLGYRFGKLYKK